MGFVFSVLFLWVSVSSVFAGGNQSTSNTASGGTAGGTVKILYKGPKTEGFDAVYAEYLKRTRDTLNIQLDITWIEHADYKEKLNLEITSGADYDLVFDASWVQLGNLAAENYYADLSGYFNNDAYPGLKRAFSPTVMENNKWFGRMCYIPLFRAFGNGIPSVHYRRDWADAWGIGEINDYATLERYWKKAKEQGVLPVSVTSPRGYFQIMTIAGYIPGAAAVGIMSYDIAGVTFYAYVKDGKLAALAPAGAGDGAFKDFPQGWNRDFSLDRYETFANWTKQGFISPDSLTVRDANTLFWSGQSASYIGNLDDIENIERNIYSYSPEAKVGYFIYDEGIRNMRDHSIPTTFAGNNGLCVPESSKRKDLTMRFLDWLFASKENHDLFELGVEGVDYTLRPDGTYKAITTYPANWPGYGFTWNPNYVTFSEYITGKNLEYRKYELKESAFVKQPITGFSFNP
jgi:putative aldouronate transport system substrate-binding protein